LFFLTPLNCSARQKALTVRERSLAQQNHWAQKASHTRSPPAAASRGKTQGFVLRLPPQNKPHATVMQPLQRVLQHHVANPHLSTHMATEHGNNHAAITLRSATRDSTSAWHRTTRAYINNHSLQNTEEEPITLGTTATAAPFIAACGHFTRENQVSCPGFLPKTNPDATVMHITMPFAASRG